VNDKKLTFPIQIGNIIMHTQGYYFIWQLFIHTISCDGRQHSKCHHSKFVVSKGPHVLVQYTAISIRFLLTTF